jgi:putative ABC transport system ATP-binding protein
MARVPVIKTVNLSKYFQPSKTNVVKALQGINIEIYSGEFIVIFGPSGCGKSTLMNIIAGLTEPSSGEIYIRGEKLSGLSPNQLAKHRRTKIGMVFQQFNLIRTMNAVENIALPLNFSGIPRRRRFARAEKMMELLGLGEQKKQTPSELSGGQQQKLAIARALSTNPWIILADEPTGNIDSKAAKEIIDLLLSLSKKSKRTVVLITHNLDYRKYADRMIYLKDGKVIKVETRRKVKVGKVPEDILSISELIKRKGKRK